MAMAAGGERGQGEKEGQKHEQGGRPHHRQRRLLHQLENERGPGDQ